MQTYNKQVTAKQFVLTQEQKQQFKDGERSILSAEGVEIKPSGTFDEEGNPEYFGLVAIASASSRIEQKDYLLIQDGKIVGTQSKDSFEAEHSPAETKAEQPSESKPEAPSEN
jgi:hypothetical protein